MANTGAYDWYYRQMRKAILEACDICWICGHLGADSIDHVQPLKPKPGEVAGSSHDPANMRPAHGIRGCPVCKRKCNREKSNRSIDQMSRPNTSRTW